MTELICICCPMGCRLNVESKENGFKVTGNGCPRGEMYAITELTAPTRTVTSSVKISGGDCVMVSVKTDKPIAKELIFKSLEALGGVSLTAPVHIGDIVLENVLGTGVNFVATRDVNKI